MDTYSMTRDTRRLAWSRASRYRSAGRKDATKPRRAGVWLPWKKLAALRRCRFAERASRFKGLETPDPRGAAFCGEKSGVIAISDSRGGVFNSRGIDPLKAMRYKERSGTVVGMPGTSRISNDDFCSPEVRHSDSSGARERDHAEQRRPVKAKIVAEAANGPTTPHADEVLARKGIMLIPDILANAGGVTVSYFEWVQDLQSFFWSEAEVNAKLESVMRRAFQEVHEARGNIGRTCGPARIAWR